MIFEINRVDVAIADMQAFEAAFDRAAALLLAVPGCRAAELRRCVETNGRYLVHITWETLADHVERYPQHPAASSVRALIGPFIQAIERAHFEPVHSQHGG